MNATTIIKTNTKTKLTSKRVSEETSLKMRAAKLGKNNPMFGKNGEDHPKWKGGSYSYYHTLARNLYSNGKCDKCGITVDDKDSDQQLDMHSWGDYHNLKKSNWTEVCRSCHKTIHYKIDSLKF